MKIRSGFVSNSSSASFVASMHVLTATEYKSIVDYLTDPLQNEDGWSYRVDEHAALLMGFTVMDNDNFSDWLEKRNINVVRFGE
jgi:hypothetical protein